MHAPDVTLVDLTEQEQDVFIGQQVIDYAEQQIREAGWSPEEALPRAVCEFQAVLEDELRRSRLEGHRLWMAENADGEAVGWLWVKPLLADMPPDSVFLEQITVKDEFRRQGYGLAMTEALEAELAGGGISTICLHVSSGNRPARRLYERAGYTISERRPPMLRLCKTLGSASR